MPSQKAVSDLSVTVSNTGGIDGTDRRLPPGTTVLSGENATNRSSFLRALATGVGADVATLKGDASEGRITVRIGDETYTRTLRRRGQETVYEGDPYLTDPEAVRKAELFSFLLRDNPIRRFVRGAGGELRDILMDPVDTDAIEARIDELLAKKRRLEDDRDAAEQAARKLSELRQQREELDAEIETVTEEIQALESEIDSFERSLEAAEEENTELKRARDELDQLRRTKTSIEQELSRKRDEKETVEAELAELTAPEGDIEELEERKERLGREKSQLDEQIGRIESEVKEPLVEIRGVVNELRNESSELRNALGYLPTDELDVSGGSLAELSGTENPTDRLLDTDSQVCLACGSQVPAEQIEGLDAQYGELVSGVNTVLDRKRRERRSIEAELDDVRDRLSEIETYERTKENLERRRASLETDIDSLAEELTEASEAFDEQRATVQDLGAEENDELIELHEELARKRTRYEQKRARREELESSIETARSREEEARSLETEIEAVEAEIDDLRGRVGELERSLKEEFNERIEEVIDILGYENLEEVEIRDRKATVREGRETVEKTVFDLHITRESEEGTYQGSLEQLSESETELVGIVIALSGYLVYDVGEICPAMILDSVDALDARRLQRLLDYMSSYQEYLIAAVHPEDVAVGSSDQYEFTIVEW
jgi:DNA repair exonuclease SbcCD ATPase subunit